MRYKKEGKLIRDLSTNERFDPSIGTFRRRAQQEADAGMPELYELLTGRATAQPEVRKATDGLDALLDEIRQERIDEDTSNRIENLVQEARVYLPKRRQELERLGVDSEEALDALGRLPGYGQGDVPMPIIRGGERTHTTYRTDGITEQELVAPFMDPSDRRVVLRTGYGREYADEGHNSEPSMMNAMKLMGNDTQWNDTGAIKGLADLSATKDGINQKVDVMIRGTQQPTVNVPLYTSLVPVTQNGRPEYGRNMERTGAAQYVEGLVKERMSRDSSDVFTAVESLVRDRAVGPFEADRRAGKLLRADDKYVSSPDKVYQKLIMPGYTKAQMGLSGASAPSANPTAPSSIHMLDLGQALKAVQSGVVSDKVAKYNSNYGDRQSNAKYERLQIKPQFPMSPEVGITDVTKTHPHTQQLLDERVLRELMI